jgi:hypothetical protein
MAKNWAIVIGINDYSYLEHLKFAKTDAEAMHHWLQQEGGFDRQGLFLFTDDSEPIGADPPIPTEPTFGHLYTFSRSKSLVLRAIAKKIVSGNTFS